MIIMLLGEGGRESALAWKLNQSPEVDKIYWAKGNGTRADGIEQVDVDYNNCFDCLLSFIKEKRVDLVMVGPELPLSLGIADFLNKNNVKVFGPVKAAAGIETDKSFAKKFMKKYNIPTARFRVYNDQKSITSDILKRNTYPVVLKASGLAAGKGVKIVNNDSEALSFVEDVLVKNRFGDQSSIIMEDFLKGEEVSVFALTDGYNIKILQSARDYKRALDGDKGLNTGGMGAFAPVKDMTPEMMKKVEKNILYPVIDGLRDEGILYQGVLYAGLMITETWIRVLEFNCRFGDPETQALMRLLKSDLVPLLMATVNGDLESVEPEWFDKTALCLTIASGGYPERYEKGFEISLPQHLDDETVIFQAGTRFKNGKLLTNGGRVLSVTALGDDLEQAREKVYNTAEKIKFKNKFFRNDIGLII